MADVSSHVESWISLSSVSLREFIDKKISICICGNSRKVGWVLAIAGPNDNTVVLQEEAENLNSKKLTFVTGHAIKCVVLEENEGPCPPKTNILELESTKEYSQGEILKQKGDFDRVADKESNSSN